MALINCLGCGARISDKALACPKCGWTNKSETGSVNAEEVKAAAELQAAKEQLKIAEEQVKAAAQRKAAEELKVEVERKAAEELRAAEERKVQQDQEEKERREAAELLRAKEEAERKETEELKAAEDLKAGLNKTEGINAQGKYDPGLARSRGADPKKPSAGLNKQGKYDPGLAASRGSKWINLKSKTDERKPPVPKGYDPGLERSRNQQKEGRSTLEILLPLSCLLIVIFVIIAAATNIGLECGEEYYDTDRNEWLWRTTRCD